MIRFRIKSRVRFMASMCASAAFIGLAIYGWDLPISTAAAFLALCVLFLMGIVGLAVMSGWLLGKLRQRRDDT